MRWLFLILGTLAVVLILARALRRSRLVTFGDDPYPGAMPYQLPADRPYSPPPPLPPPRCRCGTPGCAAEQFRERFGR